MSPRPARTAAGSAETPISTGAVPAEALEGSFPEMDLPVRPPFPPMEARPVAKIPVGDGWLFEPKWDGFRCLAFRSGTQVALQSKSSQPLHRYFPELVEAVLALPAERLVLDGEIVVPMGGGLSFDDLLQRIHPAESRVRRLARETPATFLAFDLLVEPGGATLTDLPLGNRRERLERFLEGRPAEGRPAEGRIRLSPATRERSAAEAWMRDLATRGLDGVLAKELDQPYRSGERRGMVKVKLLRTADCVVGGFRWAQSGGEVGSLLLGLHNGEGLLDHVGFSSSFTAEERRALRPVLEPRIGGEGFSGKAPGGPSRWSMKRSTEWVPLHPDLVCEVRYDHFSGDRFRHGTKFLRWRPDKKPAACTLDQVLPPAAAPGRVPFDLGPM